MCGITAYIGRQSGSVAGRIERVSERLHHRGPDDSGIIHKRSTVLAHRRLSIIDLAGGKPPIYNESGDLAVVSNGEIYNHEVLRGEPKDRHRFRTKSDSEIILHLYEEIAYPGSTWAMSGPISWKLN